MTTDTHLFLLCLLFGVIMGAIWGVLNHIVAWLRFDISKKIIRVIFDIAFPIIVTLGLIAIANIYNLGQIRWFFVLATLLGFAIERKSVGKLFAHLNTKLYNMTEKLRTKFLSSKLGKRLTK